MGNPFGSAPVVSNEPPERKRKFAEELALTLIPQLLGQAAQAGGTAMDFGLRRHLQTREDQARGWQTLAGQAGGEYGAMAGGGNAGGEGGGKDVEVTPAALRGAGRLIEQTPRFVQSPEAKTASLAPVVTPPPQAPTPKQKVPETTLALAGSGSLPLRSARVSVSQRGGEAHPFTTPYTRGILEQAQGAAESLGPAVRDASAAAREATHRGIGYDRGVERGMVEAAEAEPYQTAAELHKYEDEWFTQREQQGDKPDLKDYRTRVEAMRYAMSKVRADPRYSQEQERALGVRMLANLAKDQSAQAKNYMDAAQSGATPMTTMAGQALGDARASATAYYAALRKDDGAKFDPKKYHDAIAALSDIRENLEEIPDAEAKARAIAENEAQMEYEHRRAEKAGYTPSRTGGPAYEGPKAAKRADAEDKAEVAMRAILARAQGKLSPVQEQALWQAKEQYKADLQGSRMSRQMGAFEGMAAGTPVEEMDAEADRKFQSRVTGILGNQSVMGE